MKKRFSNEQIVAVLSRLDHLIRLSHPRELELNTVLIGPVEHRS